MEAIQQINGMKIIDKVLVSYTGQAQIVTIPTQVRIIGDYAFLGGQEGARNQNKNRYTEEVVIPSTVEEIGQGAFLGSQRLKHITLSEGITNIGDGAFEGCESLSEINFPNTLTYIGNNAFAQTNLTSIILPITTSYVGEAAFRSCSRLESIEIERPTAYIGKEAFACNNSLVRAILPSTIATLHHQIFSELLEEEDGIYYGGFCPNLNVVCINTSKAQDHNTDKNHSTEQIFPIPKYKDIITNTLYGTGIHNRLRDVMEVYREEKRCPKCGEHLIKHFLSNYYCKACGKELKRPINTEYCIGLPYNLGQQHYKEVIESRWYMNLKERGLV